MQNLVRLDVSSRQEQPQTSRIRRRPQGDDQRLAQAIQVLHEQGPSALCALWDRVEALQGELEALKIQAPAAQEEPINVAQNLVDKLRNG